MRNVLSLLRPIQRKLPGAVGLPGKSSEEQHFAGTRSVESMVRKELGLVNDRQRQTGGYLATVATKLPGKKWGIPLEAVSEAAE